MSNEETCPHLAPIQVTLDLFEGDLTLRHTECGLPVAADWTSLRAHQLPLTLVYVVDDADEDWLELEPAAGPAEQPQDAQPGRDGDGDVRAVAPALRQEFGVQAEHSTSAFPTRTEQVARELAASYSRVREPGCNPTPHYPVTRFSSDWQRLPDEPTAELDAREAKAGDER